MNHYCIKSFVTRFQSVILDKFFIFNVESFNTYKFYYKCNFHFDPPFKYRFHFETVQNPESKSACVHFHKQISIFVVKKKKELRNESGWYTAIRRGEYNSEGPSIEIDNPYVGNGKLD